MTPHKNRIAETVPMRGHNICFYREIRKLSLNYHQYPSLSVALTPLDSLSCFRHCLCTMILTWDDFEFQKAFVDIYNRQLWNNLRDREVNQAGIFYKASGPGASLEAAQVLSHPTPDNLCHRQVTFFFENTPLRMVRCSEFYCKSCTFRSLLKTLGAPNASIKRQS